MKYPELLEELLNVDELLHKRFINSSFKKISGTYEYTEDGILEMCSDKLGLISRLGAKFRIVNTTEPTLPYVGGGYAFNGYTPSKSVVTIPTTIRPVQWEHSSNLINKDSLLCRLLVHEIGHIVYNINRNRLNELWDDNMFNLNRHTKRTKDESEVFAELFTYWYYNYPVKNIDSKSIQKIFDIFRNTV